MIVGAYVSFDVPAIALGDVYVPANPYVPVSLQTLAALLVGATLGARRGFASTGLYLLLGAIGCPCSRSTRREPTNRASTVSARSLTATWSWAPRGYLIGFMVAAVLVGRLAELGWDRRLRGSIAAMVMGLVVIFAIGITWLAIAASLSVTDALLYGLWPFLRARWSR